MTALFPHIAIVLSGTQAPAGLLAELRDLTGTGFAALKERIARQQPIVSVPLFDNEFYESGAARLRAIADLLENEGAFFAIHELAEGERFADRGEHLTSITPEILRNILGEAATAAAPPVSEA